MFAPSGSRRKRCRTTHAPRNTPQRFTRRASQLRVEVSNSRGVSVAEGVAWTVADEEQSRRDKITEERWWHACPAQPSGQRACTHYVRASDACGLRARKRMVWAMQRDLNLSVEVLCVQGAPRGSKTVCRRGVINVLRYAPPTRRLRGVQDTRQTAFMRRHTKDLFASEAGGRNQQRRRGGGR